MIRSLSFIITLLLFLPQLQADVIARLIKVEGNVYFKRMGMETFSEKAKLGAAILNGDAIKVGETGFGAIMYLDDKTILKIRENTKFGFMDTQNTRTVDLTYGTLLNNVNSEGRTKSFRIQTPVSVASVKGTQFAAIVSQTGVDQFIGKEGLFEVLNMISGETVSVGPGQKAISNATGNLVQAPASPEDYPNDPEVEEYQEPEIEDIDESPDETRQEKSPETPDTPEKLKSVESEKAPETPEESEQIKSEESSQLEETPDIPEESAGGTPPKPFGMGMGIGSVTLDGVLYNQLALRPEINIGKVGIGLDLVVYMDNEGNMRNDEWDIENDPGLLLDKILFIRYGKKTDPAWIKYGSIEGLTLGYGGLMNNYSNMMEFPSVRRVGVNTGFNIGPVGGELFLSNIKDMSRGGTVTGLRAAYTVSDDLPLSIGVNFITDANMFSGLKDKDEDSYPDVFDDFPDDSTLWNDTDGDGWPDPGHGGSVPDSLVDIDADGDNIIDAEENISDINLKATPFSLKDNTASTTGLSFDIGYPVLQSDAISLMIYAEYNRLKFPAVSTSDSIFIRKKRSGSGISVPGIRSTLFGILNLSLEYRFIKGSYVPQFFDQAYDLNRVVTSTVDNQTIIRTKDMSVFQDYNDSTRSSGLFGSAGLNLFNLVDFSASYANMKAGTTELKSFTSFVNLNTDNIPKISSATAYYQRNNDDNPFDFENPSENTIMGYRVGYELSKAVSLIWDFRQFYRDDGTGNLEPIKQTTIETSFNF
jgi:hypothetical protein